MAKMQITVDGRLVQVPEQKVSGAGKEYHSGRIAVQEGKKNAAGEWENGPTLFITVRDFNKQLGGYTKGDRVKVTGNFKYGTWINKTTGNESHDFTIFADSIDLIFQRPTPEFD
jgi:single-stranded DNA-binding protein